MKIVKSNIEKLFIFPFLFKATSMLDKFALIILLGVSLAVSRLTAAEGKKQLSPIFLLHFGDTTYKFF